MSDLSVYVVRPDVERWAWLMVPSSDDGLRLVGFFNGTTARDRWKPLRVEVIREDNGTSRPLGDIANFYSGAPALSPRACESLASVLSACGELLPLASSDDRLRGWCVFNSTVVVDALDSARSVIKRLASGKPVEIQHFEFDPARLGPEVFKVPESARSQLLCLDALPARVSSATLRGFGFRKVWSTSVQ